MTDLNGDQELSPQHRLFVLEYVVDFNASAAALRAGYTFENDVAKYKYASKLLHMPLVREAINNELRGRFDAVRDRGIKVVEKMIDIALSSRAGTKDSDKVAAGTLVMKHLGLLKDEVKVIGTVRLEDLVPKPRPVQAPTNGHGTFTPGDGHG